MEIHQLAHYKKFSSQLNRQQLLEDLPQRNLNPFHFKECQEALQEVPNYFFLKE